MDHQTAIIKQSTLDHQTAIIKQSTLDHQTAIIKQSTLDHQTAILFPKKKEANTNTNSCFLPKKTQQNLD